MLPSTLKTSILYALLLLPFLSFAVTPKQAKKLTAISQEMYEQGNEKYLYVDAYKDGLLKDGEVFTISFDSNHIVLSGKELPDTYKEKHRRFLSEKQGGAVVSGKGTGTLRIKDIYDKKSCFRKNIGPKPMTAVIKIFQTIAVDAVIDDMKKDGVLKGADKFSFQWKRNTIRINGEKLPKDVAKKYIARLEKIEGLRTGNSYGFTQNMN